jgi:hypothetical protein
VYIDGFNLNYGCLAGTPHKWLNLHRLCELWLLQHHITVIKYFTACIRAQPWDKDGPARVGRQQVYPRALATLPLVSVYFGHFQTNEKWIGLVQPPATEPPVQLVPGG